MRPLVLLWGCLVLPGSGALIGPKEIKGFEGDTVSLQCTYGEKLRDNKKYWCKKTGIYIYRCSNTIYTAEGGQERTEGRVSIQDIPQKLRFKVTLRKLTLADSGEYWCGVSILGFDEASLVSLVVLPGPCCPPSPTPFIQPLATSLQPKAKAWQTQPPELTSPGAHPRVTTAKQGKTEAEASPFTGTYKHTGTSLYTGTSPYAGTSPHEETSPHIATSPHTGTSRPSTHLDSTLATETGLVPSSSSSKSRVSISMVRILAPVLVLLTLLLATLLTALSTYLLRWRKKAQLATETQRNGKVNISQLPLGNGLVPENTVIRATAPPGPAASPCAEIRCLSQTSEEEEAALQDLEGEVSGEPPLALSEELKRSVFISV